MRGINRLKKLVKIGFAGKMKKELGFDVDLKKMLFYREYNGVWQVVEIFLSPRAKVLCVEAFVVSKKANIDNYLNNKAKYIKYDSNVFPDKPVVCTESILNDDMKTEKSDEDILNILESLFYKIKKDLVLSINRIGKEELEKGKYVPDLREFTKSSDVFAYFRKKFGITPQALRNNNTNKNLKEIASYIIYNYTKDSSKLKDLLDIDENEIGKLEKKVLLDNEKNIVEEFMNYMTSL